MPKNGFTLIELLVVVLIIGILAAIAFPQYEKAVEKSRMAEGVALVRVIAEANNNYYLATGNYANHISQLDVSLQGAGTEDLYPGTGEAGTRLQTKYFLYTASSGQSYTAIAQREPAYGRYYIYTRKGDHRIFCSTYATITSIQKELCDNLNANGSL